MLVPFVLEQLLIGLELLLKPWVDIHLRSCFSDNEEGLFVVEGL
jgi:hypothetical protein